MIIDYVTLIKPEPLSEKQKEECEKALESLKEIAKKSKVKFITARSPYDEMHDRS